MPPYVVACDFLPTIQYHHATKEYIHYDIIHWTYNIVDYNMIATIVCQEDTIITISESRHYIVQMQISQYVTKFTEITTEHGILKIGKT